MIKEIKKENASVSFYGAEKEKEFYEFLELLKKSDIWATIELKDVRVVTGDELSPAEDAGKLYVDVKGIGPARLLDIAVYSVQRRAKNTAEIMGDMTPEDVASMLNMSWKYRGNCLAQMLMRGGNLIGLHSVRYSPIIQEMLYKHLSSGLKLSYDSVKFISAAYTHEMTTAVYEIKDRNLAERYAAELVKAGKAAAADEMRFFIAMSTGDSAGCSVVINPMFTISGRENIPFAFAEKIEHRDGIGISEVDDVIGKIYSLVEKATDHLADMLKIQLTYPSAVIARLVKKYRLPARMIKPLAEKFAVEKTGQTMSAHDLYLTAAEFLEDPKFESKPIKDQLEAKNGFSKLLLLSKKEWEKLDRPGDGLMD